MMFIIYYIRYYFKADGLPGIMFSQIITFIKKIIHPNIDSSTNHSRVSITRIPREVKINSNYIFSQLKIGIALIV